MTIEEQIRQTERALKELKAVVPEQIPLELLDISLSERWIDIKYIQAFSNTFFDSGEDVKIHYYPSTDQYVVDCNRRWGHAKIVREYYVRSKGNIHLYGTDLLEHALHNTTPILTYKDWMLGKNVPDNDAIQLANEKIETIRREFTIWVYNLPDEEKKDIETTYNNLYNCYRLRTYDGSHLKLPGIDLSKLGKNNTPIELYSSQKNVIWRILQQMGAIVDHEVGSGKTATMVIASYEMKRMKLRNKPCILCLKSNISDVVTTYRKAYPHAKVLAPSEKDFEPKNRQRLFHEMKNNDWDCVIMTHDQFGKIPIGYEIQKEVMQEEIDMLELDLKAASGISDWNVRKGMLKGLELRKQGLNVKLQGIRKKIEGHKDSDITFESMGIDHLFIDESHRYKNLTYETRHIRVAGLGNPEGSQKAMNMLFAIRTLQKRFNSDMQCTMLTGTPISNSLTEMYLLFKYLVPRRLAAQNIRNFDSWAAVYAKKTVDFEFSVTNQIIAKERFRHFIKVPELALFYNEIADYRTKKMINIEEPEMIEELVSLKRTPDQEEYIQRLIKFAETGKGHYVDRPPLSDREMAAKMLLATNYAKKMSCDMRLIDQFRYESHPDSKIPVACSKIAQKYREFNEHKGTQIVFCDMGVPTKDKAIRIIRDEVVDEDGIVKHVDITYEQTEEPKFTVYDEIKRVLVEGYEIPTYHIAYIHDYDSTSKKIELFRKMNNGDIRILIGSTDKAGTGLNVQERVVAMHHLDIPWKPAELTQRNGRGVRPGNWLAREHQDNKVYNYIYAVERSLDNYKFTLLKNKQTFISQMKTNELQVRTIDEGAIDEQSGMNYAEYIAILSGDDSLLQKAKLDKKIAVLENLRVVHYREQHNNKHLLEHKKERKQYLDEVVQSLKRDHEQYEQNVVRDETGTKMNLLDIPELRARMIQIEGNELRYQIALQERELLKQCGMKYPKKGDIPEPEDKATVIGKYLVDLYQEWRPQNSEHKLIGTLYGFNCCISREQQETKQDGSINLMVRNKLYVQHPDGGLVYTYNYGIVNNQNLKISGKVFLSSLNRIQVIYNDHSAELKEVDRAIQQLESLDTKPFSRQTELDDMKSQQQQLIHDIQERLSGKVAEVVE